jgi:hypothetical protein
MSGFHSDATLRSTLMEAAENGTRVRFYGANMIILAEGFVAFVGNGIVGIKHHSKEGADEYLTLDSIIKIQYLAEYSHY